MGKCFKESEYFEWLEIANRYLLAANTLIATPAFSQSRTLHRPTLHLIAHGLEVLLKATFIGTGWNQKEVAREFGHDLLKLWAANRNEKLSKHARIAARQCWSRAAESGLYQDDFSDDPVPVLEDALKHLASLHDRTTNFALRYPSDPELQAPRPRFLAETFLWVSDLALKQPRSMFPEDDPF